MIGWKVGAREIFDNRVNLRHVFFPSKWNVSTDRGRMSPSKVDELVHNIRQIVLGYRLLCTSFFFFPLGEFFGCGRKMYFFFVKIIYFFVLISKVFQCFNQVKVRVFNAIRNDVVITKRVNISIKCRVEIIEGTEWGRKF